jgi:hypothetical protein
MTVKHVLGCEVGAFPCKYLGLQLSTCELTKVQWQPILDQIIAALPVLGREGSCEVRKINFDRISYHG